MKFIKRIEKAEITICTALYAAMVLICFANVCSRFLFHFSFAFAEELELIAFIWSIMLGIAIGYNKGVHLGVSFLTDLLKGVPKAAAVIGSMPSAIVGGISFILYGMISAIGVRNIVENHVDFTHSRNLIIAAVILVSGLGFTDGLTFTVGGTSITLTSLAIAALAGIILNAILPGNDYEFGKNPSGDINRGVSFNPQKSEEDKK